MRQTCRSEEGTSDHRNIHQPSLSGRQEQVYKSCRNGRHRSSDVDGKDRRNEEYGHGISHLHVSGERGEGVLSFQADGLALSCRQAESCGRDHGCCCRARNEGVHEHGMGEGPGRQPARPGDQGPSDRDDGGACRAVWRSSGLLWLVSPR